MSRMNFMRSFTETLRRLYQKEDGAIISSELVLVGTVGVLAIAAGLQTVATSVNQELNDYANAIGSLNQSFSVNGFRGCANSFVSGSSFTNSARVNQLGIGGGSTSGSNGVSSSANGMLGHDIVSGNFSVRSVGVQQQGVNTLENCSGSPVSIQGVLQVVPNSTLQVAPNMTFQIVPNSALQIAPNSTFQIVPNSTLQIAPNSTLQFVPNSTLQLNSPSRCVKTQGGAVNDQRVQEPDVGAADATTPSNRKANQPASEADQEPMAKPNSIPNTAPKTKIPMPQDNR